MRVMIVDDEAPIRRMLRALLTSKGYEVDEAANAAQALEAVAAGGCPDAVLLDLQLPDRSGLDVLPDLARVAPAARIVMMTAYGSIPSAVKAMREGAWDYLTKPFDNDDLLATLRKVDELRGLEAEVEALRDELETRYGLHELVGSSPRMATVFKTIHKVAPLDATVLVTGESGTGKELVARAVHRVSPRHGGPFIAVNCGAIPEALVEDSFFGHVRGAFTGADRERTGFLEAARGGTLFLDEVGELPVEAQASLLRALQEREVTRIGDARARPTDFRLVAATNVDLEAAVAAGSFREDLFWRLNMIALRVPPLRERCEDIPALADHLLAKWAAELRVSERSVEPAAMDVLTRYPWPGNVRELENTLYRALVMAEGPRITVADLPGRIRGTSASPADDGTRPLEELSREVTEAFESAVIRQRLERHGYSRTLTADSLGVSRKTLFNKMRAYGIAAPGREDDEGAG